MPLVSDAVWTRTSVRLLVSLCASSLLASLLLVSAQPVAAADIDDRMAAVRAAQKFAESQMRAQDGVVAGLVAQQKAAAREVKQAQRDVNRARSDLAGAKAVLQERNARQARVQAQYASPLEAASPERYRERLREIQKEINLAIQRRDQLAARVAAALRAVQAKKARMAGIARTRKAAASRLNGAAASLSVYIKQMAALARVKAEAEATVSLASGGDSFSWPSTGRITQPYGCTGFRLNPRKGSCAHFHDGIDVVDGTGTPVRAIAAGVVAFSGWNPYDKEGRAYVVDVVHTDGFTSRYGHLLPTNHVQAGELVFTGQVIGKMGSTGKSTGTHLHFELLLNGADVNPLTYLPAGVVQIDKASTRAGLADQLRRARERAKPTPKPTPKPKRDRSAEIDPFPYAPEPEVAMCGADRAKTDPGGRAVECEPSGLFALGGSGDGPPGVPLPYRGTSPAPG